MTRRNPAAGEFYKHFKGNIYQVKCIAKDSETGEEVVVYQAMYPPFGIWVRKIDMFMSETDREKYPEYSQKYRFEKIEFENNDKPVNTNDTSDKFSNMSDVYNDYQNAEDSDSINSDNNPEYEKNESYVEISDGELKKIIMDGQADKKLDGKMSDAEIAQRGFMQILDAESYHEKCQLFIGLEQYLDERLLSNIAVAFDIVLGDGNEREHYDIILNNLQTRERYEGKRLR